MNDDVGTNCKAVLTLSLLVLLLNDLLVRQPKTSSELHEELALKSAFSLKKPRVLNRA